MTAYITQPLNSQVRITPFSQRLFMYGNSDSRLYLSRATNSLLTPYIAGYRDYRLPENQDDFAVKLKYSDRLDCIVDGLNNDVKLNNNTLTVTVGPGQCIVDTTLLVFPEETELEIPLNLIKIQGNVMRVILSVNFQWLETLYEQPPRLKLTLIDPDDPLNYGPDIWETRIDRLVISTYDINLTSLEIYNSNPEPTLHYSVEFINIKNVPYEIGPAIQFLQNYTRYVDQYYIKREVVWTKPCIDPENLKENQITLPIEFVSNTNAPIIGLAFDIRYDPTLIYNPKFSSNSALLQLNKTVAFDIDLSQDGEETGLIRIQVGENAINTTLLPSILIGLLTFYFNSAAPDGTTVTLNIENIIATYNNATTSGLPLQLRTDPVTKEREHAPILTYNFQPADINFSKLRLEANLRLIFMINGIYQELVLTTNILSELTLNKKAAINSDLQYVLSDDGELIIEALNDNIKFTSPTIKNGSGTENVLALTQDLSQVDDSWNIQNTYYYWNPQPYDLLTLTFNGTDVQTFILQEDDVNKMINNPGTYVVFPSVDIQIFEVKYDVVEGKTVFNIKILDSYKDQYTITKGNLKINNGSGIIDTSPIIHDYRAEEHIYDLKDIDLSGNAEDGIDKLLFKDSINNIDDELVFNDNIMQVLQNTNYWYKEKNLQIKRDSVTNYLHIRTIQYDGKLEYTKLKDVYIDVGYPTVAPCLWMQNSFISTRPVGKIDFIEKPGINYSTCWTLGDLSSQTGGERDFYVEFELKEVNSRDVVIQIQEDGFVINPMAIQFIDNTKMVRVWMPESFVFNNSDKQLKIVIIG